MKYGEVFRALIEGVPVNTVYVGSDPESRKHFMIGYLHINGKKRIFARSFKKFRSREKLDFEGFNELEEKFAKDILTRRGL